MTHKDRMQFKRTSDKGWTKVKQTLDEKAGRQDVGCTTT